MTELHGRIRFIQESKVVHMQSELCRQHFHCGGCFDTMVAIEAVREKCGTTSSATSSRNGFQDLVFRGSKTTVAETATRASPKGTF